jgi:TM2 domain-containing membrane protein YozV
MAAPTRGAGKKGPERPATGRETGEFSLPRAYREGMPSTDGPDDATAPGEPGVAPDEEYVYCRDCGERIRARAEICPDCGVRQRDPPASSLDRTLEDLFEGGNPFVAALLSALFPGLGQLYNRELERGLAFVVASFVALGSALVLVGFVLYPAVWLYSIYDAYTRAELRAEELSAEADGRPGGTAD